MMILFASRVILPLALITVPDQAQASILSVVTSFFSAKAAAADTQTSNTSQKMALLEAPVNPNAQAGTGSDVLVDNNTALVPDMNDATDTIAIQQNNEIKIYKVQSGDTVASVAKQFGISVNTIIWANNLSRTSALTVGKTLVVLPISGVMHKVQSGDTLQSIAKKYNGDIAEIISFNDVTNNTLKIGDTIMIPDGEISAASLNKTKTTSTNPKVRSTAGGTVKASLGIDVGSAVSADSGYYIRPIVGGVRTTGIHGNNAVDLAEACGSNIYASAAGSVILVKNDGGWNGGYGNYIVISHDNGSQTLYAHMQATSVSIGDTVTQGQMIGLLGNTGKVHGVTGCHVHFEIRNGIVNPF